MAIDCNSVSRADEDRILSTISLRSFIACGVCLHGYLELIRLYELIDSAWTTNGQIKGCSNIGLLENDFFLALVVKKRRDHGNNDISNNDLLD